MRIGALHAEHKETKRERLALVEGLDPGHRPVPPSAPLPPRLSLRPAHTLHADDMDDRRRRRAEDDEDYGRDRDRDRGDRGDRDRDRGEEASGQGDRRKLAREDTAREPGATRGRLARREGGKEGWQGRRQAM